MLRRAQGIPKSVSRPWLVPIPLVSFNLLICTFGGMPFGFGFTNYLGKQGRTVSMHQHVTYRGIVNFSQTFWCPIHTAHVIVSPGKKLYQLA